jgi:hypothetical protein
VVDFSPVFIVILLIKEEDQVMKTTIKNKGDFQRPLRVIIFSIWPYAVQEPVMADNTEK